MPEAVPGTGVGGGSTRAQVAPVFELGPGPPSRAVSPSAESATEVPASASLPASAAVVFGPSWLQPLPNGANTHAAPVFSVPSNGPPITALSPLADSATDQPKRLPPTSSLGTSLGPFSA